MTLSVSSCDILILPRVAPDPDTGSYPTTELPPTRDKQARACRRKHGRWRVEPAPGVGPVAMERSGRLCVFARRDEAVRHRSRDEGVDGLVQAVDNLLVGRPRPRRRAD